MNNESFALYLMTLISIAALLAGSYPHIALSIVVAGIFLILCFELIVLFQEWAATRFPARKKKRE